jgi:hypothetical protein
MRACTDYQSAASPGYRLLGGERRMPDSYVTPSILGEPKEKCSKRIHPSAGIILASAGEHETDLRERPCGEAT